MKLRILVSAFALALSLPVASARAQQPADAGPFDAATRGLLRSLGDDVAAALAESAVPTNEPVAILPIGGDEQDFALGLLKIAGTGAGRNVVEGRLDPMWETITEEISWDERKGSNNVLDPETLTAFGKLQAARMLLYGVLISSRTEDGRVRLELALHVSSVPTKQHLWGRSFVTEEPAPPPPAKPWALYAGIAIVLVAALALFLHATTRVR